jgi:hypothetical protein
LLVDCEEGGFVGRHDAGVGRGWRLEGRGWRSMVGGVDSTQDVDFY